MKTVGIIFTGMAGALALLGVALGVRSIPDVRRYLRIRSM